MTNEVKNVPELRFPEFHTEWKVKKLGDIGKVAMNRRIYKNQTSSYEEIPFYKIGTFGKKADTFISRSIYEEYKTKFPYPKVGDILISASGSIGRIIEYKGQEAYYQDSNIVWLDHDDSVTNTFLKQYYSIIKWSGVEGTTIKRLYNKNILNTRINLPDYSEQIKIGCFFSKLDRQIELEEQKLGKLEEQKEGYMQKIFSQEFRFKNGNGNEYPEWEEKKVYDVVKYLSSKRSSKEYSKNIIHGQYPVYDAVQEISRDTTFDVEESYISILKDGAGVGRLNLRPGKSSVIGTMGYLLPQNIDINFLFYNLKIMNFNKFVIGSTIPHLYFKDYSKETILIPADKREQVKIGSFLIELDHIIDSKVKKIKLLKRRKQGFLQKMFI